MAPRGASNWKRPHTSIYNDNYKYGTNLYSGTLSDIQKKYTDSMSRTQLRSDRPDLGLSTFAGSALGSSPTPASESIHVNTFNNPPTREMMSNYHGSIFETMLNSALHSSYATGKEDADLQMPVTPETVLPRPVSRTSDVPSTKPANTKVTIENPPRPTSLYDDAGLFTPMRKTFETSDVDNVSSTTTRRKKYGRDTSTTATATSGQSNGPRGPDYWKDHCRDLQSQVDILTQAMTDMSTKLNGELSTLKTKLGSEVADLHASLEHSSQQSNDLQKTVRKQANQLLELQTSYEDLQRHLQDSLEEVSGFQKRNQTLRKEMDRLRVDVEDTLQKSSASRA